MSEQGWHALHACRRTILILTGALLLSACHSRLDAQAELGNTVVASIASGSSEYLSRFPPAAVATIANARSDFRGEFRQVLIDETWGVIELGYCFESGAFVYLTFPASGGRIDVFDIHPSVAGSSSAAMQGVRAMTVAKSGSCMCGAVKFTVSCELKPPDACHCVQCRKFSGHYSVGTDVLKSAVKISGVENITWYHSSAKVRHGFCSVCGCSMFFDPPAKDWIGIHMGVFDDPTDTHTELHIFVAEKGDYYEISDGLPQYQRVPISSSSI